MQRDHWTLLGGGVLAAGIGAGLGALAYRSWASSSSSQPAATTDSKAPKIPFAADGKSPFPAFVKGATKYDYDLFVIGGGSGGVATARRAADQGAKVGLAESGALGGTCVNVGCVPKKLYMYASQFREEAHVAADGFGWDLKGTQPVLDWSVVHGKVVAEVKRLNGVYRGMLDSRKIPVFTARATVVDAHTVELRPVDPATGAVLDPSAAPQRVTAERLLVATGSYAHTPSPQQVPGIEHAVTSNALFEWTTVPKRVIIVGGGYIGTEFAGILHASGLCDRVTQLVRSDSILNGFDVDLRTAVAAEMRAKGIDLRTHTDVTRIDKRADGSLLVHVRTKPAPGAAAAGADSKQAAATDSTIEADVILYATGRVPNSHGLGLEQAGVKLNARGAVVVNAYNQSVSVASIFALGDVTDRVMLTPVAIAEARTLVANLYRGLHVQLRYHNIPTAVFSQPELGTVGLSEADALRTYGAQDVDLYRTKFRPMKYSLGSTRKPGSKVKDEQVVMKLVVQRSTQKVLGAHMVGHGAGEMAQVLGVALTAGATKQHFDSTIALHPSSAEEFVLLLDTVAPTPDPAAAAAAAGAAAPAAK